MYAVLGEEWVLRAWKDTPPALVNWRKAKCIPLSEDAFYVLSCCNKRNDFDSPAFLPRHRKLLSEFLEQHIAVACNFGDDVPGMLCRYADNDFIMGALWAVTGHCNMKCRHCYMEAPGGQLPELGWTEIMKILTELEKANVLCVAATGGEPLIRKDFFRFVRELVSRKICLSDIYTNGMLVTEDFLGRLKEMGVDPVFRVSFDGIGAHEKMRGIPGCEAAALKSIERICAAGFRVSVGTCVDENSMETLIDTYRYMKTLQVQAWGIARPQPMGCGRKFKRIDTGVFMKACEELLKLWIDDGCPFLLGLEAFFSGTGETAGKQQLLEFDIQGYSCSSCRKWPYISENGTLMPCPSYCDTAYASMLPNLLTCSLQEAWEEPCWQELTQVRRTQILENEKMCRECEFQKYCGGGCRVAAVINGNGLYARDPLICEVWKKNGKQRFLELAQRFLKKEAEG